MCSIFSKNVSKCLGLLCAAACIGFVSDGWGSEKVMKRGEAQKSGTVSVKATITAIVGIKWGDASKNIKLVGEDGKQANDNERTAEFVVESYTKGKLKITSREEMTGDKFYAKGPNGEKLEYSVSVDATGKGNFVKWKQSFGSNLVTWKKGDKLRIRGDLENPEKLDEVAIGDYTAELNIEITPMA